MGKHESRRNNRQEQRKLLMTRRDALKAAGYAVAGAALTAGGALSSPCQEIETEELEQEKPNLFPILFTPLPIGTFEVRNRILSTAHDTGLAENGLPSERQQVYWASKARGGIGLIVTEVQPVHDSVFAGSSLNFIQTYRPEVIGAFKPIVAEIHDHGARIVAQLWHPGKQYMGGVSSSPVSNRGLRGYIEPYEASIAEIQSIIEGYAISARHMREAGLDGVEVHLGHGYLPEQFMSPAHNIRTDEYGGSEENRLCFPVEVLTAVREAVGDDYTVGIRISGDEYISDGLRLEDMMRITPKLVNAAKLDFVNVSHNQDFNIIPPMGTKQGRFVYLAEGIKQVVDIPVFCIGRIITPSMAESIVTEGRADMVGMTRANICDPELPNKAKEGHANEIRLCAGLMYCWGSVIEGRGIGHVTCALNPTAGREKELEITPAQNPKRVMVIGAGAAGMEAARAAAERGHTVRLFEKESRLGGQLVIASKAPSRAEMGKPIAYYDSQFRRMEVEVRLNTAVTGELIEEENPDVVIVATGGLPASLNVPGADGSNVVQGRDVLMGSVEVGRKVVVVGGENGVEAITTALFLGQQDKEVEVLFPEPSQNVEQVTGVHLLGRLGRYGVTASRPTTVTRIEGHTVVVSDGVHERHVQGVDTVVLSMGSRPDDRLIEIARQAVSEVRTVGQCVSPTANLHDCILDGLQVAREI